MSIFKYYINKIGVGTLLFAVIIFIVEVRALSQNNGWWADELYSLWASDPTVPFRRSIFGRLSSDTNPPIYYSLLYIARHFVDDERTVVLILNFSGIAMALSIALAAARQIGESGIALISGAFLLLNGAVLRYVIEGRAYLLSMCLCFVACWIAIVTIENRRTPFGLAALVLLGVSSAFTHFFAGLFCGSLAVGLVVLGVLRREKSWLQSGLALGGSTGLATGLWLLYAIKTVNRLRWIKFSLHELSEAALQVVSLAFGSWFSLVLFVSIIFMTMRIHSIRPVLIIFLITISTFILIPIIISLKQPLINGRYILIGTPIVIVFLALVVRTLLVDSTLGKARSIPDRATGIVASITLVSIALGGFGEAKNYLADRPLWLGGQIVRPLVAQCGARSINVNGKADSFAFIAQVPSALFVNIATGSNDTSSCPVLGWAEHVSAGEDFLETSSDADLLSYLSLKARPDEVSIIRQTSGFVVLKRDPKVSE